MRFNHSRDAYGGNLPITSKALRTSSLKRISFLITPLGSPPLSFTQVQSLELLDSRAEQAQRSDQRDANLWESERLQKSDAAAAQRQQSGGGGTGVGDGTSEGGFTGGAYQQPQSAEDLEAKARKKAAEDKWWSAEPASPTGGERGGSGDAATMGKSGEANWWEEEENARGGSKGIDSDSLPSFFDS